MKYLLTLLLMVIGLISRAQTHGFLDSVDWKRLTSSDSLPYNTGVTTARGGTYYYTLKRDTIYSLAIFIVADTFFYSNYDADLSRFNYFDMIGHLNWVTGYIATETCKDCYYYVARWYVDYDKKPLAKNIIVIQAISIEK